MQYEIKNWDSHQQYKDKRPIHWIKLHVSLLDDYQFDELNEIDQLNLIKLWLFAAKNHGKFEGSEKFIARKIGASKLNLQALIDAGFIVRTKPYETVRTSESSVPRGEERREEKRREETMSDKPDSGSVREVFDYWKSVMGKSEKTILDSKRKTAIASRLKEGRTVDDIKQAILGCSKTPHNMGKNDRRQRYDDIELICRNAGNLERFMQNGSKAKQERSAVDEFLGGDDNVIEGEFSHESERQAAIR